MNTKTEHNKETVDYLNRLKKLWGLRFDKQLAERLKMTPQDIISLKNYSLTKFTRALIKELINK